jgi:hypothetical protein
VIPKKAADIEPADLLALVDNRVPEGRMLDYKRDLNVSNDENKREIARDVSSFANAAGGDLLYGFSEAKDAAGQNLGYPERVTGIECPNRDQTRQRIESILRDVVDPRVHGIEIHFIGQFDRGPVLLLRVPRSWNGPHMVQFRNQTHFYSRNSTGRHPLDIREIKAAFLLNDGLAARIARFRDERLGKILSGETPVPLLPHHTVKAVVHVFPLVSSFAS